MEEVVLTDHAQMFDLWRESYDKLTYVEQVDFYNAVESQWRTQKHFRVSDVVSALNHARRPMRVLEFGGWKGHLAARMIDYYKDALAEWTNIEICEKAIQKTCTRSQKYRVIKPDRFDWFSRERTYVADACVSTDFIEHLSNAHFDQLARYVSGIPVVYFGSPIGKNGHEWDGFVGSHILTYGWVDVNRIMEGYGYSSRPLRSGRLFLIRNC